MKENEVIDFIKNYTKIDYKYIECNLSEAQDNNYDFRMSVCELAKENLSICSDNLIIDLYIALSNSAKKTFAVYRYFHLYANEILNRGHIKYFDLYLDGAMKSFDTLLASSQIQLEEQKIIEIIDYIQTKSNKEKYQHMLNRFHSLLKKH